ncbi:Na-translocating system protein MpsC family protein [Planococcus halotolerans]|uniref:Na-translocating system protein MpsC family protein n=1 Tax=Planococcus halotolerans TaxID=2233542 RepID=UPI0010929EEE|nr:Na-translocating system protein MpsC family protein [Planococcus halotolerans]QHJ71375.1 DUF2294 family protein [Planococcus halotolerans]
MTENHAIQSQISAYTAKFLKDHFGESPRDIEVKIHIPFLVIHLQGFLLAPEELLINRCESKRILESRDLLMNSLKEKFLKGLSSYAEFHGIDLFYDWNLAKQSGLLLAVAGNSKDGRDFSIPSDIDEEPIKQIIEMNSTLSQKRPEETDLFWLSSCILLIRRTGILVDIEKQLIKNGVLEELRMAKRPLEYRITKFFNLDYFLPRPVEEIFVDWDFCQDISYMVLIMERPKP